MLAKPCVVDKRLKILLRLNYPIIMKLAKSWSVFMHPLWVWWCWRCCCMHVRGQFDSRLCLRKEPPSCFQMCIASAYSCTAFANSCCEHCKLCSMDTLQSFAVPARVCMFACLSPFCQFWFDLESKSIYKRNMYHNWGTPWLMLRVLGQRPRKVLCWILRSACPKLSWQRIFGCCLGYNLLAYTF